MENTANDVKVYFVTIPAHKYLHIRNYESNGCRHHINTDSRNLRTYSIARKNRNSKIHIVFFLYLFNSSIPSNAPLPLSDFPSD